MGTVYKPTFTKPLPSNGELFRSKGETFARVKPPKGRAVTYRVTTGKDGSQRIVVESGTYIAKYRDGSGWCIPSRPVAAMKARLEAYSMNWNAGRN